MSTVSKRLSYVPQLDSFRFFAVLLVIFSHWLENTWINRFPNGYTGVTFFFVLSGFLISANLLNTKKFLIEKQVSFGHAIKTFYARRTIRIFPLYFLAIILVYLFAKSAFEGHLIWYLAYVPNLLIFKLHYWPGMLSHFWSLGVEEQFYLLWPVLIFLSPEFILKYLFSGIILLSIIFKYYVFKGQGSFFTFHDVLPVSCFDAFGAGALLALYINKGEAQISNFTRRVPAWVGFSGAVCICWIVYILRLSFLFGLSLSLTSVLLIRKAVTGSYHGIFVSIIDNSLTRYLGKISYGLYVYHNFVPWLLRCCRGQETRYPLNLPILNMNWIQGAIPLFIIHFLLLLLIASISWFLIEKPFIGLKKYFE